MPARTPSEFAVPAKKHKNAASANAKTRSQRLETLEEKFLRASRISAHLAALYSEVECPLTHRNNFELLVAVILSAQCTDAAVNKVTPGLFARYPNPIALANA